MHPMPHFHYNYLYKYHQVFGLFKLTLILLITFLSSFSLSDLLIQTSLLCCHLDICILNVVRPWHGVSCGGLFLVGIVYLELNIIRLVFLCFSSHIRRSWLRIFVLCHHHNEVYAPTSISEQASLLSNEKYFQRQLQ